MSGMAQATGVEALARASQLFDDKSYATLAGQMIGAFKTGPPVGMRVSADGGNHYLIYSFAPRYRVLNAFLQSLIGLYDYIKITGDQEARRCSTRATRPRTTSCRATTPASGPTTRCRPRSSRPTDTCRW